MIDVHNLSMMFGQVKALDNASFQIQKGITGLLGPNGSGKTTTIRILSTILIPTQGSVTMDHIDVIKQPGEIRKRIGYLPEQIPLYSSMEVGDYLKTVGILKGLRSHLLNERLEYVGSKFELFSVWRKLCRELSKGFRQRVGLAQAFISDPPILILDEPTSGLDPTQILMIRNMIREFGKTKTVIISTHILSEAESMSDVLIVMNHGKVIGHGTADELKRQSGAESLETLFTTLTAKRDAVCTA